MTHACNSSPSSPLQVLALTTERDNLLAELCRRYSPLGSTLAGVTGTHIPAKRDPEGDSEGPPRMSPHNEIPGGGILRPEGHSPLLSSNEVEFPQQLATAQKDCASPSDEEYEFSNTSPLLDYDAITLGGSTDSVKSDTSDSTPAP
ncbi:hypothetical protein DDE82_008822 [Stemphylium lycopersici]|uniref:Uncharacterized protein n=1 Tax=Stemphylium lycopersici TaxID=183478 RepID=A0A364MT45_STELY|nr:hypothetical protein TW65_09336 [Stemphylium lycopersici]RAQ98870.1 hypothetical protein DDE82_008822 [Stemphylium lycopersici]RAR02286.1 hypothetical protein DDE83_008624 [Stemphylium lycopersici]